MNAFNGYDSAKEAVKFEGLQKGGYELRIMSVKPVKWVDKQLVDWSGKNENPDMLEIYVDICDGVYKDYFSKNYRMQTGEDKKWRGIFKLYFPKDDGTKEDGWTKNAFARAMNAIEDSNEGYHWNWDEKSLKGLKVGGLFNMRQYIKGDGKIGEATNLASFCDIAKIRDGSYKLPEDKLVQQSKYAIEGPNVQNHVNEGFYNIPDGVEDEALPFN